MSAQLDTATRATGIGASEIAAIVRLSPYTSPLDIYCRKRGLTEEFAGNESSRWGLRLEAPIAEAYTAETGIELIGDGRTTIVHPVYEFALCTPDRIAADRSRVVEIKTAGIRMAHLWGDPGSDDVPEYYLTQVAWQMAVLDIDMADIAVLIGGNDFRIYSVPRDRELEDALIEAARRFWFDNVLAGEPPAPRDSDEFARVLSAKYPAETTAELTDADDETERVALALHTVRDEMKRLEAEELALENAIKAAIGENAGIRGRFGKITWKATKERAVTDYKALCSSLDPAVVKAFTQIKPGVRRFLPTWAEKE
jgi:putative phage-type endonuclease